MKQYGFSKTNKLTSLFHSGSGMQISICNEYPLIYAPFKRLMLINLGVHIAA